MLEHYTPVNLINLQRALVDSEEQSASARLEQLVHLGLDTLPAPGSGATLQRWQALAAVAQSDLSLVKLFEGHVDALTTMNELNCPSAIEGAVWGMWAAEAPEKRVTIELLADGKVLLEGSKAWCSGAATVSHALLTAWYPDGRGPQLVQVPMRQSGVSTSDQHWRAVGMQASASIDVHFHSAHGVLVGHIGDYLARPGFWQGGAGIAACWFGGSQAIASALRRSVCQTGASVTYPFRLAALGKVDLALQGTAALLRQAAHSIDMHPLEDASILALRVRQSAEGTARYVLDQVLQTLGATLLCKDPHFARAAADLPVFIRQSHAERDFAALGERLCKEEENLWML